MIGKLAPHSFCAAMLEAVMNLLRRQGDNSGDRPYLVFSAAADLPQSKSAMHQRKMLSGLLFRDGTPPNPALRNFVGREVFDDGGTSRIPARL